MVVMSHVPRARRNILDRYNCARATRPVLTVLAVLYVSTIKSEVMHITNNRNSKLQRRHLTEKLTRKLIEVHISEPDTVELNWSTR